MSVLGSGRSDFPRGVPECLISLPFSSFAFRFGGFSVFSFDGLPSGGALHVFVF